VIDHAFEARRKVRVIANFVVLGSLRENANRTLHCDAMLRLVVVVFRGNHQSRRQLPDTCESPEMTCPDGLSEHLVTLKQAAAFMAVSESWLAKSRMNGEGQIFWKVEFPASAPPIAGLRIGSTLAVVGVVVGELVGGNVGLGYLLSFGEDQANTR
jgi:Binding-protein-dependent transport system inner membrane component